MQKDRSSGHQPNEWALIQKIQGPDAHESESAFAELYDLYSAKIVRQIRGKGISVEDAEMIESDVWAYILENIHAFENRGKSIWRWISRIIVFKVKEFWRAQQTLYRREKTLETDDDLTQGATFIASATTLEPPQELEQAQLTMLISQALETVENELQQNIIILRYFGGMKLTEIAEELCENLNTVKVYHRRAIQKLRDFPGLEGLQS